MQNNLKIDDLALDGSVQDIVVPDGVGGVSFWGTADWKLYDGAGGKYVPIGAGTNARKKGQLSGETFKVKGTGTLYIIYSMGLAYGNPLEIAGGSSSSGGSGSYYDTPVSGQITLSGTAQQLTTVAKPGYLQIRCTGEGFVGGSGVTDTTGGLVDGDSGYLTLSFADISTVYAVGSGTLSFVGGYIN
jgi:hypothetical protein